VRAALTVPAWKRSAFKHDDFGLVVRPYQQWSCSAKAEHPVITVNVHVYWIARFARAMTARDWSSPHKFNLRPHLTRTLFPHKDRRKRVDAYVVLRAPTVGEPPPDMVCRLCRFAHRRPAAEAAALERF
jgi:hypothetical protein